MSTRPCSNGPKARRSHASTVGSAARALGLTLALLATTTLTTAHAADPAPASLARVDASWFAQFSQRAEQLTRLLLSAMSAARDEGALANARCFDDALHALHSLQRQVAFHGERVLDPALAPRDRERHTRALTLSNARLDYVAQSTARCSSEGASVAHGQTRVETSFESTPRR